MSKGNIGIIGLGIMGGAIAKNLAAAGWQVIGFDITKERCEEAKAAGVEIAKDAAAVAAKATNILVSLPKPEALTATVDALVDAKLPRRVIAELSTFSIEDKTQAEAALRAAGHVDARLPALRHRRAGAHQRPRRLCERRRAGDPGPDAGVRGFLAPGA